MNDVAPAAKKNFSVTFYRTEKRPKSKISKEQFNTPLIYQFEVSTVTWRQGGTLRS